MKFPVLKVSLCLFVCLFMQTIEVVAREGNNKMVVEKFNAQPDFKTSKNQSSYNIFRTRSKAVKGSIFLFPAKADESSGLHFEHKKTISFFNQEGFDVFLITDPLKKNHPAVGSQLAFALKTYRNLKSDTVHQVIRTKRIAIVGFQSGGNLVARMIERLDENEQPDQVLLVSPSALNETITGTVLPQIMPPIHPKGELLALFAAGENKLWYESAVQYVKKYKGFDGRAAFKVLSDNDSKKYSAAILKVNFPHFFSEPQHVAITGIDTSKNPAAIPKEGYSRARHEEKVRLVGKEKFDLIMIGNSITNNFEKPAYQAVWKQFFAPRKALNLGFSGYRTENILWNIDHGELDGQSPKVVTIEIGTNNVDEKNYPLRHTAGQLAEGIEAIVKRLRVKLPDAKIILLRCFPGSYDGANPTSHRAILERASDLVSKLADRKHIFYCDVNHVFLNLDGSIDRQLMGDYLHPTPAGAKAWAQAMEPLLSQLMGDQSLDAEIPKNTAIVPVTKLETDSYNWFDRHAEVLAIKDSIDPEIVLIGNSITHFWGGLPAVKYADGRLRKPNGEKAYADLFSPYRVLNLGFGWDRTQNVLWRLDHGEIDALHPKLVVINIGTNNTSGTQNARMNTASEIVEGIEAICRRIRSKIPNAKIVVMAVFPREKDPKSTRRILINEINKQLADFTGKHQISFLDIGPKMINSDGTFLPGMMLDFTHPSEKGYAVWADGLRSFIQSELLK